MTLPQTYLKQLKTAGYYRVHIAFYGQTASITRPYALQAKADGFLTEIGKDGFTTSNFDSYEQGVEAEATLGATEWH
jgi:hypothetical protein